MLTIGQLTRRTGVPARTIRFYHAKGIIPEPARDQSGYRRYTARDAATLIKIRTMGAAGVPLADIQRLLTATPVHLQAALVLQSRLWLVSAGPVVAVAGALLVASSPG
jgi:DNA-binding transcriptional MerR regulator